MPNEKHLEFVQLVIARMAGNSFFLKGWSVTLTAGLFALATKDSNPRVAAIAFVPALAFWLLDAYYLRQERLFRALYDRVRTSGVDHLYSMDITPTVVNRSVPGIPLTLLAPSVISFHGVLLISIVSVFSFLMVA